MATSVYSLSISGRVILDMHSLNNEGGEGNQITTRMVNIVYNDRDTGQPRLASVNAISGDMFKHIQAEHLYLQAKADGLPLCAGCRVFSASRVLDDAGFMRNLASRDAEVIDALLQRCVMDDMAGNLIARGARSIPRKSVAEFGWVVGLPEVTRTESYFHVRYAAERGERAEGEERVEQPIFHRPASSGVYALVATFEMARIGFNDITQSYPTTLSDAGRKRRYRTLLESILYTFVEPNGAMRGTQNPHIVAFEGIVGVSTRVIPAPTISPLNQTYREEVERVTAALNGLYDGAIQLHRFDSTGGFAEVMTRLIRETQPYKLTYEEGKTSCG